MKNTLDLQKLHFYGENQKKAEKILGWKRKITFEKLVEDMVKGDLELVEKQYNIKNE